MDRAEVSKLKKLLLKEMQLFRMREPNMRKHEYHYRLRRLQEADLTSMYQSAKKSKADGRDISPEEILRNILIKETSPTPLKNTSNQSCLMILPDSKSVTNDTLFVSRANTQLMIRPALQTVQHIK